MPSSLRNRGAAARGGDAQGARNGPPAASSSAATAAAHARAAKFLRVRTFVTGGLLLCFAMLCGFALYLTVRLATDLPHFTYILDYRGDVIQKYFVAVLGTSVLSGLLLRRLRRSRAQWLVAIPVFVLLGASCVTFFFFFRPALLPAHGASFFRIGAVSETSVNLLLRAPGAHVAEVEVRRSGDAAAALRRISAPLRSENVSDATTPLRVDGLEPDTRYTVAVQFCGASGPATCAVALEGRFRTAPRAGADTRFRLALSSCIFPQWRELIGLRYMADAGADLQLLLGDTIYSDHPFFLGPELENFRARYRRVFADPHMQTLMRTAPTFFMLDDHEVYNDHVLDERVSKIEIVRHVALVPRDLVDNAMRAYDEYLDCTNPDKASRAPNQRWYSFAYGRAAFFVTDAHT